MIKLVESSLVIAEMRKTSHPPYSPELTHSDFCLFGYVKKIMMSQLFSSAKELLSAIGTILDGIAKPH
jgi:hypothetical protein